MFERFLTVASSRFRHGDGLGHLLPKVKHRPGKRVVYKVALT